VHPADLGHQRLVALRRGRWLLQAAGVVVGGRGGRCAQLRELAMGKGSYVNGILPDDVHRLPATYDAKYARLARIKAAYDPDNLFRRDANIPSPAATARSRWARSSSLLSGTGVVVRVVGRCATRRKHA
jgi:hypothetical protein